MTSYSRPVALIWFLGFTHQVLSDRPSCLYSMKTYTVCNGQITLWNKARGVEISPAGAIWSRSWTWGVWGSLSPWRNQVWSLEADFLRPPGNTFFFDGFGNFLLWGCAKGKSSVDLDPSARDVRFVPWRWLRTCERSMYFYSRRSRLLKSVLVCVIKTRSLGT